MKQISFDEELVIEVDGKFFQIKCTSVEVAKQPEQPAHNHYRFCKIPEQVTVTLVGFPIEQIQSKYI